VYTESVSSYPTYIGVLGTLSLVGSPIFITQLAELAEVQAGAGAPPAASAHRTPCDSRNHILTTETAAPEASTDSPQCVPSSVVHQCLEILQSWSPSTHLQHSQTLAATAPGLTAPLTEAPAASTTLADTLQQPLQQLITPTMSASSADNTTPAHSPRLQSLQSLEAPPTAAAMEISEQEHRSRPAVMQAPPGYAASTRDPPAASAGGAAASNTNESAAAGYDKQAEFAEMLRLLSSTMARARSGHAPDARELMQPALWPWMRVASRLASQRPSLPLELRSYIQSAEHAR